MSNSFEFGRQKPYPLVEDGKGYNEQLQSRSQAILNALLNLLPSTYKSSIEGPNYTKYLKAMAAELARVTISLEKLGEDVSFEEVRSEFLWDTVGYLVFLNRQLPDLDFDDESFREFLLKVIDIYFQGATPESISDGVELFRDGEFEVKEVFKEAQKENTSHDISDQWEFIIDFDMEDKIPDDLNKMSKNIRLLLEIIRPAHTIYQLRFVFGEDADILNNAEDELEWELDDFRYEDVREYHQGLAGFSSTNGAIEPNSKNILKDTSTDKPLESVRIGARLFIETGPNSGVYEITGHPSDDELEVFPGFERSEDPVSYRVEIDRLGTKKEIQVTENVSDQFYDYSRLTVNSGGPYNVNTDSSITLTASSNGEGMTYKWDFNGDNQFDDATGQSVTYNAGSSPDTIYIAVLAIDERDRKAKDFTTITVS